MKIIRIYIISMLSFILTFITIWGKPVKAQELYPVEGKVCIHSVTLEEVPPLLVLTFDIYISAEALNNRQSLTILPELTADTRKEQTLFPSLLINGRQKEKHFKRKEQFGNHWQATHYPAYRIAIPCDTTISYKQTITYEEWMDNASLTLHYVLTSPREKRQLFSTIGMVRLPAKEKEVEQIPEPPAPEPEIEQPAPPVRTITGEAFVQFKVGEAVIHPHYMFNRNELEKIEKDLRHILGSDSRTLLSIRLTGYASPEGARATNERLSAARTDALKRYLSEKYGLSPYLIETHYIAEDWTSLRTLIEESYLPGKQEILSIINSYEDEDTKEKRLRALPVWNTLLKDFFPQLRRVDYQLHYTE